MDMNAPPWITSDKNRVHDRAIGDILRERRPLSDKQLDQILQFQRKNALRFGEAAVALNHASHDDVLWALSQQFHYPYAPQDPRSQHQDLVVAANPFGLQAEVFRDLRSQLLMGVLGPGEPRRALAVVSPDIGDGKTFMAANLAAAFSQLGARTLLLDADMRTPRQHHVFGMSDTNGLSNILSGRSDANVIHRVPDLPSLYVFPVGAVPPNPLELLQRPAFGLLLHELLQKFDHIVVDTPASVHGADARVVAARCGAALVVGRKGTTRVQSLQALVTALGRGPTSLAGVILNEW